MGESRILAPKRHAPYWLGYVSVSAGSTQPTLQIRECRDNLWSRESQS